MEVQEANDSLSRYMPYGYDKVPVYLGSEKYSRLIGRRRLGRSLGTYRR